MIPRYVGTDQNNSIPKLITCNVSVLCKITILVSTL